MDLRFLAGHHGGRGDLPLAVPGSATAAGLRPPGFVDEFTDTIHKRRYKEAYEMSRGDTSFLGRVLTAGMSRVQYGLDDAHKYSTSAANIAKHEIQSVINYFRAFSVMATMLGLVGSQAGFESNGTVALSTATGMIASVLIAIPCALGSVIFSNKLVRLDLDVRNISDDLLTQMYHNSKKASGK